MTAANRAPKLRPLRWHRVLFGKLKKVRRFLQKSTFSPFGGETMPYCVAAPALNHRSRSSRMPKTDDLPPLGRWETLLSMSDALRRLAIWIGACSPSAKAEAKASFVAAVLVLGACGPSMPASPLRVAEPTEDELLFLADSQLSAMTGGRVLSSSPMVDAIAEVAIRPPESNLTSALVLQNLLSSWVAQRGPSIAFYLGDAINISCGGELASFENSMRRGMAGEPWFIAHGNHDSYFMGNFSTFVPPSAQMRQLSERLEEFRRHGVSRRERPGEIRPPHYFAWWNAATSRSRAYEVPSQAERAWPAVCASPNGDEGVPMNKLSFTAWQVARLRELGVQFSSLGECETGGRILGSSVLTSGGEATSVSLSAGGATEVSGDTEADSDSGVDLSETVARVAHERRACPDDGRRWEQPDVFVEGRWVVPSVDFLGDAWRSFIVQRVDVSCSTSILLVDTSVAGAEIGQSRSLRYFGRKWAGDFGRVGPAQLEVIGRFLDELRSESRTVVVAGHMPLDAVLDRAEFEGMLASYSGDLTYVSAHTHRPPSVLTTAGNANRIRHINIGSTTDWPMTAVAVQTRSSGGVSFRLLDAVPVLEECHLQTQNIGRQQYGSYYQACEHAPVAEALASLDPAQDLWTSPDRPPHCDVRASAQNVEQSVARMQLRFDSEPDYRTAILCLARTIGSTQCGPGHDSPCEARQALGLE